MNTPVLGYLIESFFYLFIFSTFYRLAISNLTHFNWMRFYLLASLLLSILLPLIQVPNSWLSPLHENLTLQHTIKANISSLNISASELNGTGFKPDDNFNILSTLIPLSILTYLIMVIYKFIIFFRNLLGINKLIRKNPKSKMGKYWIVASNSKLPAFSFFNYIFINENQKNITESELQQIKTHEFIHSDQLHTLDVLFVEIMAILFWFNPLVHYAKLKLKEVHEFIADEKTAVRGKTKKQYAQLLLKLTSDSNNIGLSTGFSSKQISNRIFTISKKRSLPRYKYTMMLIIPLAAILLLSFSYISNDSSVSFQNENRLNATNNNSSLKIGSINWVNNTVYSSAELTIATGLKVGDNFSKETLNKRIENAADLYLDNGYLFANIKAREIPFQGKINLTFTVFEGRRGKIRKIEVKGNKNISTQAILNKMAIKSGGWFSKAKLNQSYRAILSLNGIDKNKCWPRVIPGEPSTFGNFINVDLVFEVTEK